MSSILEIAAAVAVLVGSGFGFLGALGLVRFPDLYTRIHASSKAGVVGAGFVLIGLALVSFDFSIVLRSIVAILFLILTAPISAHLLARATYLLGVRPADITRSNELTD